MKVNSRGRALRDAHGATVDADLTLKGSNRAYQCTLSGSELFLDLSVGVAQRSPTATDFHPFRDNATTDHLIMETLDERIARVLQEHVSIVPYDPDWPRMFAEEKQHLLDCLPSELIRRIEHFGSTAIPGLAAKPIVDMLVEVTSLEETKTRIVPVLESQGYDYFWRPTRGDDTPPFYAWFIKRDATGARTHHIHMIEREFEQWERLLFRDYLIEHPEVAKEYEALKLGLANDHPNDRIAYTEGKADFVVRLTHLAKTYYQAI